MRQVAGWRCRPVDRSGTEAPPIRSKVEPAQAAKLAEAATRAEAAAVRPAPQPAPKPEPVAKAEPMPAAAPVSSGKPMRPQGLAGARGGKADNLQVISGIGPKLEKTLHGLGFYHFDQIAGWSRDEVDWVDEHLRFKGRIDRDQWIPQAKLLAAGDMDKFSELYGTGGLKNKAGQRKSGSRTRKS